MENKDLIPPHWGHNDQSMISRGIAHLGPQTVNALRRYWEEIASTPDSDTHQDAKLKAMTLARIFFWPWSFKPILCFMRTTQHFKPADSVYIAERVGENYRWRKGVVYGIEGDRVKFCYLDSDEQIGILSTNDPFMLTGREYNYFRQHNPRFALFWASHYTPDKKKDGLDVLKFYASFACHE
jgi:hypothetical protein